MDDSEKTRAQLIDELATLRRELAAARQQPPVESTAEPLSGLSQTVREQARQALGRLSHVVRQMGDGVMITDREGILQYVNPAFEEITGYSREEALGQTPAILKSGAHGDDFYRQLWSTIRSGRIFRSVIQDKKKNGDLFYAQHTITPLRDSAGEITQFVSVWKDITDQKRAEEERRQLEQSLIQAERMATVGTVAAGIVHNLKGQLTPILGYGELLLLDQPDSQPLQQLFASAKQMNQMVEDILAKSRVRKTPEPIDMNALLHRELDFLRANPVFKYQVEKEIRLGDRLPRIEGVYIDYSQIFGNLLRNAVDAMHRRPVRKLTVASSLRSEQLTVEVADTGCGIPEAHIPHLFDPFFTTKSTEAENGEPVGTGLGLFTVRRLLIANGAGIQVESTVDQGTTFRVEIPVGEET